MSKHYKKFAAKKKWTTAPEHATLDEYIIGH